MKNKKESNESETISNKDKISIDKKDKNQVIGLIVTFFILLILNGSDFDAGGIAGMLGGFVGAIFISSILGWIYFKLFKKERTPNQKIKVILIIAIIDVISILLRKIL